MDGSSSNGRSALHSAEAAAARASQIAAAAMAAGAAAEEAAVDAEDYETASKYAQELLGSLGKPSAAAQGKRFYGTAAEQSGRRMFLHRLHVHYCKPCVGVCCIFCVLITNHCM